MENSIARVMRTGSDDPGDPSSRRSSPRTTPRISTSAAGSSIGPERAVRGLEHDLGAAALEALQRGLAAAHERHHRLAVPRVVPALDHHEVAVADLLVDHRVAAHAEHEGLRRGAGRARAGTAMRSFSSIASIGRPRRRCRGAAARPRRASALLERLDRARAVPRLPQVALLDEVLDVLVHGRDRGEAEVRPRSPRGSASSRARATKSRTKSKISRCRRVRASVPAAADPVPATTVLRHQSGEILAKVNAPPA